MTRLSIWTEACLGDLGKWGSGGTPKSTEGSYYGGSIPWIRSGDLPDGPIESVVETITESGLRNSSAKWVPENSVLVAMYGATIGKLGLTKFPVTTNQAVAYCIPDQDKVIPQFLFWFLRLKRQQLIGLGQGGAQPNISQNIIKNLRILLPPLDEQHRIVMKAAESAESLQRARGALDWVPRLVERYKQAVLAAAFRGELTAGWRVRQGLTAESEVRLTTTDPYSQVFIAPASWDASTVGQICSIVGGSQPPKSMFKYEPQDEYVRLIQIRDYKSAERATYVPRSLARRFCAASDVMIGRYGPPIFQILRGLEGAYNVALMKAIPANECRGDFLFYRLQDPSLRSYVEMGSDRTAGQDGVNKNHLLKYPIFLPSIEEQTAIVETIESAFMRVDRLIMEAAMAAALTQRLEQRTLAKAFRGELVATNAEAALTG